MTRPWKPEPCYFCGRDLVVRPVWWVNVDPATNEILAPGEVRAESGMYPVGSEWIRRVPKAQRIPWREVAS